MEITAIKNLFVLAAGLASLNQGNGDTEAGLPVPPPGEINGKIYYVETWFKANWYRASQFCRYQGMSLASINNQKENDKLTEMLNITAFNSNYSSFWTSKNDLDQTNQYTWSSAGTNLVDYFNWNSPDNPDHLLIDGETEHCIEAIFMPNVGIQWNDRVCLGAELNFICEKQS